MNSGTPAPPFHDPAWNASLLPGPIPWFWIIAAFAALIVVAFLLFVSRIRRKPSLNLPSRHQAYAEAQRSLDQAASLDPRAAATQASMAIRNYLSAVARDPSLFETHEEFLKRHPALSQWPDSTVDALVATLKQLAEIKYRPAHEPVDASTFLDQSRSLLQSLDQQSAA